MPTNATSGLTDQQRSDLEAQLLEARRQLLQRSQSRLDRERDSDVSGVVLDPMDAAEQEEAQSVPHLLGEAERDRLAEIEDALSRMKAGTYGVSVLSGEPIGFPRLSREPWTRYTLDEAERLEQERGRAHSSTL
jgi:DnaK suppressor protein